MPHTSCIGHEESDALPPQIVLMLLTSSSFFFFFKAFYFIYLAMSGLSCDMLNLSRGMQDLGSPIRDQTQAPFSERVES